MANFQQSVRRIVLPIFQRINPGDITIRHHWTGDRIRVHSFQHKGYWWYGREREAHSMALCARLIRAGDTVFDVGSHIGYLGIYFSWLAGERGQIYCFEPSPLNLRYLDANVHACRRQNIRIIRSAVGDHAGDVPFFMESLTGQNSTVVADFTGLQGTSSLNGLHAEYEETTVPMLKLDSVPAKPDFIKIDVESAELAVLKGMENILTTRRPRIMLETNPGSEALTMLNQAGYELSPRHECNFFAVAREDAEGIRILNGCSER